MARYKITLKEKENPPKTKEAYSTLNITVSITGVYNTSKTASLKMPKPLVEAIVGPYDKDDNYTEELLIGRKYTYKATQFKDSALTPIKHIWWAEQLDDGDIVDLEVEKDKNMFVNAAGVIEFDYVAKKCEKVCIYAYVATPNKKMSIESKVSDKKLIAFFIGGAADKENFYSKMATNIMNETRGDFHRKNIKQDNQLNKYYKDVYLGYNDARGNKDIENKIVTTIPNKNKTAIYIIGHSLGGWNGAHLLEILTNKGYNVDLLITLDPVGTEGATLVSDIYWTPPQPKANYWINIKTSPENYQADDFIADIGGQWIATEQANINDECTCNHRSTTAMLNKPLKSTAISAREMLLHQMRLFLSKQH